MSESPTAAETIAPARAHLREALEYLDAHGVDVVLNGDPLRYHIGNQAFSEGGLIAYAARILPLGSNHLQ